MSAPTPPSTGKQARVAALQWGLVQAFVLDTLGRLLRNYYRATTGAFFGPDWVASVRFATPLGLLVGGIGGYRWVTSGRGVTSASAHRDRTVFVGAFVAVWVLAVVPTMAFEWLLGDDLFTVPYFVLPTVSATAVPIGAYVLAYRVEESWYRRHRSRLLGAVRGAVVGVVLGFVGFIAYAAYLAATQTNYSLDGGPGIVVCACLGALVGYALTDADGGGDRSAEFLVLLLLSLVASSVLTALGLSVLRAVGWTSLGSPSVFVTPLVSAVLALCAAGYLAYGRRTTVYRRLVGR